MAIDTAAKRRGAATTPFLPMLMVNPTASKDIGWRYEVGWAYSGDVEPAPSSGTLPHQLPFLATMGKLLTR